MRTRDLIVKAIFLLCFLYLVSYFFLLIFVIKNLRWAETTFEFRKAVIYNLAFVACFHFSYPLFVKAATIIASKRIKFFEESHMYRYVFHTSTLIALFKNVFLYCIGTNLLFLISEAHNTIDDKFQDRLNLTYSQFTKTRKHEERVLQEIFYKRRKNIYIHSITTMYEDSYVADQLEDKIQSTKVVIDCFERNAAQSTIMIIGLQIAFYALSSFIPNYF